MSEHGDHAVHIAVPVDLLRALIELACQAEEVYDDGIAVIELARALLPQGDDG